MNLKLDMKHKYMRKKDIIRMALYNVLSLNKTIFRAYLSLVYREKLSQKFNLIYNYNDLKKTYYNKMKNSGSIELEHQIGRLTNFKRIIHNCRNISGDFIEFGTYKGFSLAWIAYLLQREKIFNKKIIGLDGFIGVPYTDGEIPRFSFSDSSLQLCRNHLYENNFLKDNIKKNIFVEQALFNESNKILKILKNKNLKKFCFIHIDCDVFQSVIEIFDLLLENNLIADRTYVLFDDYGLETNLKNTVQQISKKMSKKWKIKVDSSTNLTMNYFLQRKGIELA